MTNNTFLTKNEIFELTGARQAERQRRWLAEHGYLFDVRIDGSNVILRSHIEEKLGIINIKTKNRIVEPNFSALQELLQNA